MPGRFLLLKPLIFAASCRQHDVSLRARDASRVFHSLLAAVGGFTLAGRIASGDPLVGTGFEIDSIAATALGGTLLAGGIGSIGGPMAGVAVLALVANGLKLWNVATYYQMLVKGALLVNAVSAHRRVIPGRNLIAAQSALLSREPRDTA